MMGYLPIISRTDISQHNHLEYDSPQLSAEQMPLTASSGEFSILDYEDSPQYDQNYNSAEYNSGSLLEAPSAVFRDPWASDERSRASTADVSGSHYPEIPRLADLMNSNSRRFSSPAVMDMNATIVQQDAYMNSLHRMNVFSINEPEPHEADPSDMGMFNPVVYNEPSISGPELNEEPPAPRSASIAPQANPLPPYLEWGRRMSQPILNSSNNRSRLMVEGSELCSYPAEWKRGPTSPLMSVMNFSGNNQPINCHNSLSNSSLDGSFYGTFDSTASDTSDALKTPISAHMDINEQSAIMGMHNFHSDQSPGLSSLNGKSICMSGKKHKCHVCLKRFTRPSSLATHILSHTGEKPFACDHSGCGRKFSVVSNLRRHKKIHVPKLSSP